MRRSDADPILNPSTAAQGRERPLQSGALAGDGEETKKAQNVDGKRWSQRVTRESDALTLEKGVFTKRTPRAIARSLKRSADRSRRRKSNSYRSAMSMLTFYINRAGKGAFRKRASRNWKRPRTNCASSTARLEKTV